ncbi:hypothetical protein [Actinoplanes xinjiangensis]|uniref:Uncharacterized protein n=1 Tax=Actinoplanes xinjiangensis TaxID=512350 RepID=A0A316F3J3_9ACTN|nr:hypothetical protein [Actinoplanes xinjiangensis]PWK31041.1 hypothetical protein BC793_13538 [Actinoplanes xinjiangensis]GIF44189.1 hypothetical protein Axi01nite_85000 [Actinoplanes xinjiangensis]
MGQGLLWSLDGCSQNDFIPYKTQIRFTDKQWRVPDVSTLIEQWSHNNGTVGQMVNGKPLHR